MTPPLSAPVSGSPAAAPAPEGTGVLSVPQWREAREAHRVRALELTRQWREAHEAGTKHPVEDFLFQYYMVRPSRLERWHPGVGRGVEAGRAGQEWPEREWYGISDGVARVDAAAFLAARSSNVAFIEGILRAVARSQPRFSCFGMHEWAMVYRQEAHRHPLPLRLGQAGTDAVVESHTITCSHYDAFRFFTPAARPLNTVTPTRERQCELDQAGCLHANMDLYKYAAKLGPLVPGELLLDCFALAREIRWLDMQASPYDVSSFGVANIPVELPAGKEEYVRRQRDFSTRAQVLRSRLLAVIEQARAVAAAH